mmetsp:Transcript_7499/g.21388  ORF Transcript_7499/g.21388 Transcript_7499/m.21388 type:complete len:91 (+) Transcript_7499:1072-1344(+)|eukprot:CAMPEP_0170387288 /NCGR_PEP_ID=MMETSP0117_2-20130122/17479_1 /TAXON_ID=400756 /ORGANISM="Durinskia baltica, Strain CSIRO CS-38" /LENGTH=90 /DNA_ID=CAMNT_0010643149 /DNA_START=98 /DNA_END=370 /DNA_ORIENTATION=-
MCSAIRASRNSSVNRSPQPPASSSNPSCARNPSARGCEPRLALAPRSSHVFVAQLACHVRIPQACFQAAMDEGKDLIFCNTLGEERVARK